MNFQKKNEKLAEFLGWTKEFIFGNGVDDELWVCPKKEKACASCPDIINNDDGLLDLAIQKIRENQFYYVDFPRNLFKVVSGKEYDGNVGYFFFDLVTATNHQKAQALLETINE